MNITRLSLGIITFSTIIHLSASDNGPKLYVLPYSPEISELYIRLRNRKIASTSESLTDTLNKKYICHEIINSEYFQITHPVETDKINTQINSNEFNDATKHIHIRVNLQTFQDYAFLCPAQNQIIKKNEQYYVSEPYNVNEAPNWTETYISGYFIFTPSRKKNTCLVIHSFAEESAKISTSPQMNDEIPSAEKIFPHPQSDIEDYYLQVRNNKPMAKTSTDDPLCKLSHFDKTRVCASVLQSLNFDKKMRNFHVANECERKPLLFRTDSALTERDRARIEGRWFWREEWMLSCEAEHIVSSYKHRFYISRGYSSNAVFVYVHDNLGLDRYVDGAEKKIGIYLLNRSTNISVIVDE